MACTPNGNCLVIKGLPVVHSVVPAKRKQSLRDTRDGGLKLVVYRTCYSPAGERHYQQ